MNKNLILIAGGASVASLAAGAAGGYLYAKNKFNATVNDLIALEVASTKKYYAVLLAEAKAGKPDSPADIVRGVEDDDELEIEADPEYNEADLAAIEKGRETLARAGKALVDYQGFDKKPSLDKLANGEVATNIFSKDAPTPQKRPSRRGPDGKFLPKSAQPENADEPKPEETPQLISQQDFLLNDGEYEQRNLLYFKSDDTMIDLENNNEVVGNGVVGEVNLTLFPEADDDGYTAIYVRNEWLETDYEVRLMTESLTSFLGLGTEDEGDFDEMDAAEHRTAREDEDVDDDEYANQD